MSWLFLLVDFEFLRPIICNIRTNHALLGSSSAKQSKPWLAGPQTVPSPAVVLKSRLPSYVVVEGLSKAPSRLLVPIGHVCEELAWLAAW